MIPISTEKWDGLNDVALKGLSFDTGFKLAQTEGIPIEVRLCFCNATDFVNISNTTNRKRQRVCNKAAQPQ